MKEVLERKNTVTLLNIKHMVSSRCISAVKQILANIPEIEVVKVFLGGAEIQFNKRKQDFDKIDTQLHKGSFELIYDKEQASFEQIKIAVLEMIFYGNNLNTIIRNSDYLSDKLGMSYFQLSKLFSEKSGITLEKFTIMVKIEKVKELLSYDEMTLSEISYQMGYSSVQYLSTQFKQVTGFSVSEYRLMNPKPRIPLDEILK